MIVARQKPIPEIVSMVSHHERVLLVGCNTCAAVALAGGEKEVETLAEYLRLATSRKGTSVEFAGCVLQRQCEPEYIEQLDFGTCDAVLSLGCGAGVALLASTIEVPVYPALDTLFIGAARGLASWQAECSACGKCVLGETAGICPVTRCAKGIMNGPCGGVSDGRCELGDRDCAWVLIHDRLERLGHPEAF
ncbi:MAG: methylenetetrahydrofolate reductase C-terminal domain-containing protein, partial [Coriobacteriia bacterium]|nr:methylenetetrahydrofolate reductase C-terminal domain-containing protein [Coriobacteriia bacterium]